MTTRVPLLLTCGICGAQAVSMGPGMAEAVSGDDSPWDWANDPDVLPVHDCPYNHDATQADCMAIADLWLRFCDYEDALRGLREVTIDGEEVDVGSMRANLGQARAEQAEIEAGIAVAIMRKREPGEYFPSFVREATNDLWATRAARDSINKRFAQHKGKGRCPTWRDDACRCDLQTLLALQVSLRNAEASSRAAENAAHVLRKEVADLRAELAAARSEGLGLADVRRHLADALKSIAQAENAARAKDAGEPPERRFKL